MRNVSYDARDRSCHSSSSRLSRTMWAARPAGSSATRTSYPSTSPPPSEPIDVVTTGTPKLRLVTIFPLKPAPMRRGTTLIRAVAKRSARSGT